MIRAFDKASALFKCAATPSFTTDGCSGWMTFLWLAVFGHVPPWNGGCVIHDWYYWSGGQSINAYGRYRYNAKRRRSRAEADKFLYQYIKRKGYPVWAVLCWIAVRFGGSQYLPFSWRWRYRERYLDVLMGK